MKTEMGTEKERNEDCEIKRIRAGEDEESSIKQKKNRG